MGATVSSVALRDHEKHLSQLCGPIGIHISDPFWNELAHTCLQLSSLNPKDVQNVIEPYCQQLLVNSRKTQNFQTLIVRIMGVVQISDDSAEQQTAANGICFLKFVMKSLVEKLPGHDFLTFMDGAQSQPDYLHDQKPTPGGLLGKLVRCLLDVIIKGCVAGCGYLLIVEALQCLLVGCSTQLYIEYVTWSPGTHPVIELLMEWRDEAAAVIQNLIDWYVRRLPVPSGVKLFRNEEGRPSVLKYVRTAAVSVLWLPVTAYKYLVGSSDGQCFSPLADASQLLLFVLVHHVPHQSSASNPYRQALSSMHDTTYIGGMQAETQPRSLPSICFADLYRRLAESQEDERGTLMLYTIVQCIQSFRDYALIRSDPQTLLLPILKHIYHVSTGSQSQLYLLSILLLIFSQDAAFGQTVHGIVIASPEWYKERSLGKLTLGSFVVLSLLRMAHTNLIASKDLYLHTNTVAALANVISTAVDLDAFASQRFLGLIDLLSRKLRRPTIGNDIQFKTQFYDDFLHMMLEVLNGVICPRPANNPNLVYASLQRQRLFDDIASIPHEHSNLVQNIQSLLTYFNDAIDADKIEHPNAAWTVQEVLDVVNKVAPLWTTRNLQSVPELRFSYEEESSADQFFVPVVWTLIVAYDGLPWNTEALSLFTPQTPTASVPGSEEFQEMPSTSNGTEV